MVRILKFRFLLPVTHLMLYGCLILWPRFRDPVRYNGTVSFDAITPIEERLALSINAPAAAVSLLIASLVGYRAMDAVYSLTAVLLLPLWYLVGAWLDLQGHFADDLGGIESPGAIRTLGIFLLTPSLFVLGWQGVSIFSRNEVSWLRIDAVLALLVWPLWLSVIAVRMLVKGRL